MDSRAPSHTTGAIDHLFFLIQKVCLRAPDNPV